MLLSFIDLIELLSLVTLPRGVNSNFLGIIFFHLTHIQHIFSMNQLELRNMLDILVLQHFVIKVLVHPQKAKPRPY